MIDQVGWAISRGGNKTRARKNFYLQNKQKYISPWFPREEDATTWQNEYVFKRQKQSTMTLYEILKESEEAVKNELEPKIQTEIEKAIAAGKISSTVIKKYIEPILELQGKTIDEFTRFLADNNIEVVDKINEMIDTNKFKNFKKPICPKCGGDKVTTGLRDEEKGFIDGNWVHICLNPECKEKFTAVDQMRESDTGGMAAFNGPASSEIIRKQKAIKKKFKKKSNRPDGYNEIV